jgi:hypothetical protein
MLTKHDHIFGLEVVPIKLFRMCRCRDQWTESMDGIKTVRRVKEKYHISRISITSSSSGPGSIAGSGVSICKPYRLDKVAEIALEGRSVDSQES